MSFELWGVIAVIVCALFTVAEFMVHFLLARNLTDEKTEYKDVRRQLGILVAGLLGAPTVRSRRSELRLMKEVVKDNDRYYDMVADAIERRRDEGIDPQLMDEIEWDTNEVLEPVAIFDKLLEEGDVYQKGYACRRLADLEAVQYIGRFRELITEKDRDLSYNAGMALSQLGDAEGVADYVILIQNDRGYSNRIVNEIFDEFLGDRNELVALLLERCNDYMKTAVIKAIEDFKLERFRPEFRTGATGNDKQLKIACIRALGAFGDPRDEQILQMGATDQEWVIRSAAIKGLSNLKTKTAFETVRLAMYDKEWWVRRTAASSLLQMGVPPTVLEEILSGSDRFAADALKNELYKKSGL